MFSIVQNLIKLYIGLIWECDKTVWVMWLDENNIIRPIRTCVGHMCDHPPMIIFYSPNPSINEKISWSTVQNRPWGQRPKLKFPSVVHVNGWTIQGRLSASVEAWMKCNFVPIPWGVAMFQKTIYVRIPVLLLINFGSVQLGDCNLKIIRWHGNDTDIFGPDTDILPVTKSLTVYWSLESTSIFFSLFFTRIENFFGLKNLGHECD